VLAGVFQRDTGSRNEVLHGPRDKDLGGSGELATIGRTTGAEDDLATQATARSAQALVRSARGEHDGARRLAREAVDMHAGAQSPWFHGNALMTLAEVSRAAGVSDEAAEAARAALALFQRKGNEPGAASARALIDEVSG